MPALPDVARLVSAYLRTVPEVLTLAGERVYTVFPKQVDPQKPMVLVQRVGGIPLSTGRPLVVDVAVIQVDAYGGPQAAAYELASTVNDALVELEGEQPGNAGNVCRVRPGPLCRWVPDDSYEPSRARYVSDLEFTVKPAGVVLAGAI